VNCAFGTPTSLPGSRNIQQNAHPVPGDGV